MRLKRRAALVVLALSSCGGASVNGNEPIRTYPVLTKTDAPSPLEVQNLRDHPRLALVARDGDPFPAVAVATRTARGPVVTTALAGLIEARMARAGFPVKALVFRDGFVLVWEKAESNRLHSFFSGVAKAFLEGLGSGDEKAIGSRLASLKRHPLENAAEVPIVSCSGALGVASDEATLDLATPEGFKALERIRTQALVIENTSFAAVGTTAFVRAAADAGAHAPAWPHGSPVEPSQGRSDVASTYATPALRSKSARLSLAVEIANPELAVAAAHRLQGHDSPLRQRLIGQRGTWTLSEVSGSARAAGGGCLVATVEGTELGESNRSPDALGRLSALVRHEMERALSKGDADGLASSQVLGATSASEAASRAAWWGLAEIVERKPMWAAVARTSASDTTSRAAMDRFVAEYTSAMQLRRTLTDRRSTVEAGQGEFWVLLANPCGVSDEDSANAGAGSIATVAAALRTRPEFSTIEPWVSPYGLGIIAHSHSRDRSEDPLTVARRTAEAAARPFANANFTVDEISRARDAALTHLDNVVTRGTGGVLEAVSLLLSPEHPSWVDPFGLRNRVFGLSTEAIKQRWSRLTAGPLRVAVLSNVDRKATEAAYEELDRWFIPREEERACSPFLFGPSEPGQVSLSLPRAQSRAELLFALPVHKSGSREHTLLALTAYALNGDNGLLRKALGETPAASVNARIFGAPRLSSLLIHVSVPKALLQDAQERLRPLFGKMENAEVTSEDFSRATAAWRASEQTAVASPRERLIRLWLGETAPHPTFQEWKEFLASHVKVSNFSYAEAVPEGTARGEP